MKKILQLLSSILTLIFVCCGLHFIMQGIGLSSVEQEFRLEKVKVSEVETFEISDEYGVPQTAFVQLACRQKSASSEFSEIFIVKTDKGLYLPQTGTFFETTSLERVAFDNKGKLRPAYVKGFKGGLAWTFDPQKASSDNWDYSALYGDDVICENGLMQNYLSDLNGQVVRFNKTYDYEQKLKRVRTWHPEVLRAELPSLWNLLKEKIFEVFTL